MKEVILGTVCILFGVLIGRLTHFSSTPEPTENAAVPVKIVALEGMTDNRPAKDNVDAMVVFDKEVPNGYGLLVVDLKHGGFVKLKLTNTHGQNVKWGDPINRLHTQFSPKQLGLEPTDFPGRTARFYSSDFPPEVLRKKHEND